MPGKQQKKAAAKAPLRERLEARRPAKEKPQLSARRLERVEHTALDIAFSI